MGCGRSKPHSRSDSSDDSDMEKKRKKSKHSSDKNHKIGVKKENIDPAGKDGKAQIVRKDSGMLKNIPSSNGNQPYGEYKVSSNSLCDDSKMTKLQASLSTNNTQNKINSVFPKQIRITNSQIEFFRMLDEKIAQGKDLSEEDLAQRKSDENLLDIDHSTVD